jgi:hypothetical protein
MPGAFLTSDQVVFDNVGEFAEAFVIGTGTATSTGSGIFDNGYVEAEGVYATAPLLNVRESLLAGLPVGQTVTVRGTAFSVINVEPDGLGRADVRLERQ